MLLLCGQIAVDVASRGRALELERCAGQGFDVCVVIRQNGRAVLVLRRSSTRAESKLFALEDV